MKYCYIFIVLFISSSRIFSQETSVESNFKKVNNLSWKIAMDDDFTKPWQQHWFMDGEMSYIIQNKKSIDYYAGKEAYNDAGHTVLWTKKKFSGAIKIEYDFTRIDSSSLGVNILYVLATGSGKKPYEKDIYKWKELRKIPTMATYYNHINTYHISYAAFLFNDGEPQYIRARRYIPETKKGLKETALKPEYKNNGLFATGEKHQITVIKKDSTIYMKVENLTQTRLFWFDTSSFPNLKSGRIGLRQMWTRASTYANFKIYEL